MTHLPHQSAHPSRVAFQRGHGGLPMLAITTPLSSAEVYLHGAHVTHFARHGEAPLLFMSHQSRYLPDAPIRGGIPIIYPWFGKREDLGGQHGFARLREWEVAAIDSLPDGALRVTLSLPDCPETPAHPPSALTYVVTVGDTLTLELSVTNRSASRVLTCETCLHTYFTVGDSSRIRVTGLKGTTYLDQVEAFARKIDHAEVISIAGEVDRLYLNTSSPVDIHDPSLGRRIRVATSGSHSTVVWNPWIAKSKAMPDFGDDEYHQMVCVESGNVSDNALAIPPGAQSTLSVTLSSHPAA